MMVMMMMMLSITTAFILTEQFDDGDHAMFSIEPLTVVCDGIGNGSRLFSSGYVACIVLPRSTGLYI